ncbi:MAG: hypothetical protein SGJ13_01305 [Actinomycetota bacterium]|nr:hypothetical protein [Actinomycetota bacterium]
MEVPLRFAETHHVAPDTHVIRQVAGEGVAPLVGVRELGGDHRRRAGHRRHRRRCRRRHLGGFGRGGADCHERFPERDDREAGRDGVDILYGGKGADKLDGNAGLTQKDALNGLWCGPDRDSWRNGVQSECEDVWK